MFADALPDPSSASSIGWLLLCAAAAIASINQVDAFVKRRSGQPDTTIGPSPLVVKSEDQWVSKESFEKHTADFHRTTENIFSKIGGVERGFRTELDEKISEVREKVEGMAIDLSAVKREAEIHTQQLNILTSDIKQLLSRS